MPAGMSWGRWPRYQQHLVSLRSRFDPLPDSAPMLPYGNGRSYGDVCLNSGGSLLVTRGLDRFIAFDADSGILECEAGVLLSDIIDLVLPLGWFPAVTPGTAFVTVGGAIANDVHGKNHHRAGSFGHCVLGLELLRSTGEVFRCSADECQELFQATIGGLGLTGLILTARLKLRPVASPWIVGDSQRFSSLSEFLALAASSEGGYEYTVAWIDCSRKRRLGRGIFMRGNHAERIGGNAALVRRRPLRLRFTPPVSPINGLTVALFNEYYYRRAAAQTTQDCRHYGSYLYPLDRILEWNRVYGPRGFFQYQCVLPPAEAPAALAEILQQIARSGQGSFLSVLKQFGDMQSLGMLSFPRPGVTFALDFPNRGASTLALLDCLDDITRGARGAVYPAKDARMSPAAFREYFPAWERFQGYVDPKFSSSFWRRVADGVA
jgi:FAD/FMN-containing dehydrogenase